MKTEDLNYDLPEELIAQEPATKRDDSRLLVVHRDTRQIDEDVFSNVGAYLNPGDALVLNETKVIRARMKGAKKTGGHVEIFLLHETDPGVWEALVRPSARVKPGTIVAIGDALHVQVNEILPDGRRRIRFEENNVLQRLEDAGEIPLPPYIHRNGEVPSDSERYQTVYAHNPGAVAAPTAGLHFTPELFDTLEAKQIQRSFLTLHVGYGTFKPIQVPDLANHAVDPEEFYFPETTANTLNAARDQGGRIVSVGTTSTRVLETRFIDGKFVHGEGSTNCYIYPPYTFRGVDVLLTNFHLPKSSLLALVSAFGGKELIQEAYQYAVENKFRFYSYGDAMLIL
jgi:S-adenosylmethionine:tRNA ribosyltransferase-isomerase